MPLTAKAVAGTMPRATAYKLADGQGLYLFVSPAGGKSWRANYSEAGKQRTRTYGQWPAVSLADARRAHQAARQPTQAVAAPTSPTFATVAHAWMLKHLPSLENIKHRGQVQGTLERFVYPAIGQMAIDTITRVQLVAVVSAAQAGDRIETAHRVAGRVTAVFDYAVDAGVLQSHPASNLTRVLTPRRVKRPMASIPPAEAGDLLRAIAGYPDLTTRLALQLMAHTFVRVGELLGMRWDELREDGAVWVVPAERVKGKDSKPHVVPLSTQAQAIVQQLKLITGGGHLVLDSPARPGHPLSENTLLFALYRLGYRHRMTVHGFRALASTVLNEQSGFGRDVIERQLSHRETDDVRAAYNRAQYLNQRRELMQWWGDWLDACGV